MAFESYASFTVTWPKLLLFFWLFVGAVKCFPLTAQEGSSENPEDNTIRNLLLLHNQARASEPAANMNELIWNVTLADLALSQASRCSGNALALEGAEDISEWGVNAFLTNETMGVRDLDSAFTHWSAQRNSYISISSSCSETNICLPYLQVVWATALHLGCGIHQCADSESRNKVTGTYIVCLYDKRANEASPYIVGDACSQCSSGLACSSDGLCKAKEIESSPQTTTERSTDTPEASTNSERITIESGTSMTTSKATLATETTTEIETSTQPTDTTTDAEPLTDASVTDSTNGNTMTVTSTTEVSGSGGTTTDNSTTIENTVVSEVTATTATTTPNTEDLTSTEENSMITNSPVPCTDELCKNGGNATEDGQYCMCTSCHDGWTGQFCNEQISEREVGIEIMLSPILLIWSKENQVKTTVKDSVVEAINTYCRMNVFLCCGSPSTTSFADRPELKLLNQTNVRIGKGYPKNTTGILSPESTEPSVVSYLVLAVRPLSNSLCAFASGDERRERKKREIQGPRVTDVPQDILFKAVLNHKDQLSKDFLTINVVVENITRTFPNGTSREKTPDGRIDTLIPIWAWVVASVGCVLFLCLVVIVITLFRNRALKQNKDENSLSTETLPEKRKKKKKQERLPPTSNDERTTYSGLGSMTLRQSYGWDPNNLYNSKQREYYRDSRRDRYMGRGHRGDKPYQNRSYGYDVPYHEQY